MPSTRTIALTATSVLAIVAAGVVGATAGSRGGDDAAASSASSGVVTSRTAPTSAGSAADGTATSSRGADPTGRPPASPDLATGSPGSGSEILPTPAGPSGTATGYHLPDVSTAEADPMFGGQIPKPAVATGRLVAGFPEALAPPQGAKVDSSSLAVTGTVVQAALVASGASPVKVLAHYRESLSSRGFTEKKAQGVENSPAAAFTRGRNNVTITTQDGKTYVLANLRPKDAQG